MKKSLLLGLFFTGLILVAGLVSAADIVTSVGNFFGTVSDVLMAIAAGLEPIVRVLFGSENLGVAAANGDFSGAGVIANIFIFLIVYIIVYLLLDSIEFFSASSWSVTLLSLAVSILSVRFLSDGMINAIIFPYKALGIALAAGLPFVLYFVAVELKMEKAFARKMSWIFLAVIYVFLYAARWDSGEMSTYAWIYLVAAGVALLMMLMDGTFASLRVKFALGRVGKQNVDDAITEYKRKIADLPGLVTDGVYTHAEADKKRREYRKEIEYFESRR